MSTLTAGQIVSIDAFGAAFARDVMAGMVRYARDLVAADIDRAVRIGRAEATGGAMDVLDAVAAGQDITAATAEALSRAIGYAVDELERAGF